MVGVSCMLSLEIVIEEAESVDTQSIYFEYRENKIISTCWKFWKIRFLMEGPKQMSLFVTESFFSILQFFLIDSLINEIDPLVTEDHEFEPRDESTLLALFGFLGLSKVYVQKNGTLLNGLPWIENFPLRPLRKKSNQTTRFGDLWVLKIKMRL